MSGDTETPGHPPFVKLIICKTHNSPPSTRIEATRNGVQRDRNLFETGE